MATGRGANLIQEKKRKAKRKSKKNQTNKKRSGNKEVIWEGKFRKGRELGSKEN